ncbi:MAG TPA: response regulator transcription factor [Baekduia sp.]
MIRVVIADDHGLVRAGLAQLVGGADDIEVVAVAGGGREAIEVIARTRPDVVLMDLSMPDLDGIAATRAARRRAPETNVVILTSFSDRDRIVEALDAGAVGYLLKDAEPEELLRGIRAAARGESPLAPKAAAELIAGRRADAGGEPTQRPASVAVDLTAREREILSLLAEGRSNKVIARRLDIAEQTVKNHLSRIFQTLGVTDRTQAALWAQRHGGS